jgi:hypothetical protein
MELRQFENESAKAFKARCDYFNLGPARSLEKLVAIYRADPKSCPTTRTQTLKTWSAKFRWQNLSKDWDQEQAYALAQQIVDDRRAQHRKELAEFHRVHNATGRSAMGIIVKLTKQLAQWAEAQADVELDPSDSAKVLEITRIMQGMERYSDWWAKSLAVDKLLESLNTNDW